jgi:hypothetical protein
MRMNKKAGTFGLSMMVIAVVLIGLCLWVFVKVDRKAETSVSSLENLTNVYLSYDRANLYFGDASELASQQAFYSIAKMSAENPGCFTKSYQNRSIVIWNAQCGPEKSSIEKRFLLAHNNSFNGFVERYPEKRNVEIFHALDNGVITTKVKSAITGEQQAGYAKYNVTSELDKTFTVNLSAENISLDDFVSIYQDAMNIQECKKNKSVEQCISEISLERWSINTTNLNGWILFELSTKKPFFFEENGAEQFKPIELKFGIEA